MKNYTLRLYFYKNSNPDEVKITKQTIKATTIAEARDKELRFVHKEPRGFSFLNSAVSKV